jgi:hypothetical protein
VAVVGTTAVSAKAASNEFGGWVATKSSLNTSVLIGARSQIANNSGSSGFLPGTAVYGNRVDLEFYNSTAAGLIQAGIAVTGPNAPLDDCGTKVNGHDFVEYKPVSSSSINYSCFWYGTAFVGSSKKYTVGKTSCQGCYDAHIDGQTVASVNLATSQGTAGNADLVLVGSEVTQDDTSQNGYFNFGDTGASGDTPWQWSSQQLSSNTWTTVGRGDIDHCENTNGHFNFGTPWYQGDFVARRVTGGPCPT